MGEVVHIMAKHKTKHKSKNINKDNATYNNPVDTTLDDFSSLYADLLAVGKTAPEAREIVENMKRQEQSNLDKHSPSIRISYSLSDIMQHVEGWEGMPEKERERVLWGVGFDVKRWGYHVEECWHKDAKGNRVFGAVVVSSERTDRGWTDKRDAAGRRVASDAAINYVRLCYDQGFREEYNKLSR